ncbi:TonB family protein [Pseudoduganella lutea]|uniref:TonB family protein n=1 Tax=Pseudoduganella lutea TaxID=321985 RepID=A0A4P6KX10_9BURK|nr:TonB family protein [Pseudoduganella lutea]QBE63344.1 TonB family protein [Pseudoduganella lutea]
MPLTRLARTSVSIIAAALCAAPAVAATTPAVADFNTCDKPVWPKEALRQAQQGKVTLAFKISEAGAVTDSRIVKSSGFPMLDMAARDGIMKCRFVPATQDGKPQAAWMKMQYVWTLEKKASDPAAVAAALEADRQAAEGGDAAAALRMAKRYMTTAHGSNDPHNQEQGAWWLRKAADGGNTQAMEILGMMLFHGRGMAQDKADGVRWIEQAAEQGAANAQATYGFLLLRGEGVTKNEAAGEEWLLKAAQQDHPQAQTQLAWLQIQRGAVDAGTIALLERAAERGEMPARLMLARCYERGAGVAQDHTKAFALYARAAASGSSEAKRALVSLYDKGAGLPEDRRAASTILGRADAPAAN